ncbi:hypothetical protein KM043_003829 [Ampulex compressa]|nr:hypothetical protein KM043_003829 [Ampulex compressa]
MYQTPLARNMVGSVSPVLSAAGPSSRSAERSVGDLYSAQNGPRSVKEEWSRTDRSALPDPRFYPDARPFCSAEWRKIVAPIDTQRIPGAREGSDKPYSVFAQVRQKKRDAGSKVFERSNDYFEGMRIGG